MKESEVFQLLRPDGRRGIVMGQHQYDLYSSVILDLLDQSESYSLNDVLEKAKTEIAYTSETNLAWNILQVKLDLEARGLIKVVLSPVQKRVFHLRLTRTGIQQIRKVKAANKVLQ